METGRRVSAIMVVYTNGLVPDMLRFRAIADRFGLKLIADAAAAIGAKLGGVDIGKLGADLSILSFNGNKTITSGGGGMLLGQDEQLIKRCSHLSSTARVNSEYEHDEIAFNYRMTNIQAAVGLAQMERVGAFLERKKQVRALYNQALCGDKRINEFPVLQDHEDPCWLSGVTLSGINVDTVIAKLGADGVQSRRFYRPLHLLKPYASAPKFLDNSSEAVWPRIITLPCSTGITDDDIELVVKKFKAVVASL